MFKPNKCSVVVTFGYISHVFRIFMVIFIADVDSALNSFKELQKLDPYRLENMDTYSNLLYVKV